MSSRNSLHVDERRPLAVVDTDTTDYYDEAGGLPPPHRLSSVYNNNALSFSPPSSTLYLPNASGSQHSGLRSTAYGSADAHDNEMSSTQDYASAGNFMPAGAPPSQWDQSYGASSYAMGHSNTFDSRHDLANMGDDQAFLSSGHDMAERGGMSPAVAARERYMARKEAQSSPYTYAAGAGATGVAAGKRGCFSGKRKWAWIIGAVVLIAAIVGIAVGVSQANSSKSTSGDAGVSGVVKSDGNDPSKFDKDSRLHQSFYGMCYTPLNAQYPACGDTLDAVIEDVQLLSQVTTRLRLYGSDCQVASLVLEAIQKTKVNMQVYLAAWVPQPSDDPDNTVWNRQKNAVLQAIQTYGEDNVSGVTVGNEYLLNDGPLQPLLDKIVEMRQALADLKLSKTIPVGTADAGSKITTELAEGCDYVMANVHPWFGGVPIDQAAAWTWSYTANQEPSSAAQASNDPTVYIAETGWPTQSMTPADATYQGAVSGVPQLNEFLSTYVCQANANTTAGVDYSKYFYFEMFDEPWKEIYGGVEPYWGLFTSEKKLKDGVVIPDCSHP